MKRFRMVKGFVVTLVIAAMLCTCLPMAAFAEGEPKLVGGLQSGGIYDVDGFTFFAENAGSVSVSIDGKTAQAVKDGNVFTANAAELGAKLGKNVMTVTADGTEIFNGTVIFEQIEEAEKKNIGGFFSDTNASNTAVRDTENKTLMNISLGGNTGTQIWMAATENYTVDTAKEPGIFKTSIRQQWMTGLEIQAQIFYNSASNDNFSAPLVGKDGNLFNKAGNPALTSGKWYTITLTLDSYNGTCTIEAEDDDGTRFSDIGYGNNFDKIKNAAMRTVRWRLFKQSDEALNFQFIADPTVSYSAMLPTVKSVLADDEAITAQSDGIYKMPAGTAEISVNMSGNINNTSGITIADSNGDIAGTVTVSGGVIKADAADRSLGFTANSEYTLTIPADVTDGKTAYGAARIIKFRTGQAEFSIRYPKNGKVLEADELDKIRIAQGGAEVHVLLNGEVIQKTEESENIIEIDKQNVKLGENILEAYGYFADGSVKKQSSVFTVKNTLEYLSKARYDFNDTTKYVGNKDPEHRPTIKWSDYIGLLSQGGWGAIDYEAVSGSSGLEGDYALRTVHSAGGGNVTISPVANLIRNQKISQGRLVFYFDFKVDKTDRLTFRLNSRNMPNEGLLFSKQNKLLAENGVIYGDESDYLITADTWHNLKLAFDFNKQCTELYYDTLRIGGQDSTNEYVKKYFDNYAEADFTSVLNTQVIVTDSGAVSSDGNLALDFDNAGWYWEAEESVALTAYGSGNTPIDETHIVPAGTREFYLTTPMYLTGESLTADKIKFMADGENLTQSVEKLESNSAGTDIKITINKDVNSGTKAYIVIAEGTQHLITDSAYAVGMTLPHTSELEKPLSVPVYFGNEGIFADSYVYTKNGVSHVTATVKNSTDTDTKLCLIAADYGTNGINGLGFEELNVSAGGTETKTVSYTVAENAESGAAYIWKTDSLRPMTDKIVLK